MPWIDILIHNSIVEKRFSSSHFEERWEGKSGKTPHFLRLRWDGDALLKNYQPRLFYYFYYRRYNGSLNAFFAGEHAVNISNEIEGKILLF